ncbi:MAG: hypothetical protein ABJB49_06410, partial [Nitrospirota bacterium]
MRRNSFGIALLLAVACLFFAGDAPSASAAKEQGKLGDDSMLNNRTLDESRAATLNKLIAGRASGVPFAIQEIEVLDAFEAGLSIASIEADVVISRAVYDAYVAGNQLSEKQRDVLGRYRVYNNEHARDLVARNAQLNADHPEAKGTSSPDDSRDWELYSDPELFNQLSSGFQNRLERIYGHKGRVHAVSRSADLPTTPTVLPNTLVNNPAADGTAQDTQSETTLVLGAAGTIISSFNDSGSNTSGSFFTGIARSTNLGDTWTDQGTLPAGGVGDAGDPVLARNNTTGTIILATLGFNSAASLPIYRSTNDGISYFAQVDGDGGGTSNDKEWLACDNFAGAGQGNFYMFYRDFGGGGGMSFTRSTDGGATWSARQILASASGQGAWVTVGADHTVYGFWLATGNNLVFKKSTDQGVTFGAQTPLTTLRTTGVNGGLGLGGGFRTNAFMQVVAHPTVATQLYAIWNDKGISPSTDKANIYFSQTTNGGTSWSAPIQVNTDAGTNDQWQPVIAITPDGTGLFTSWYDRRLDAGNSLIEVFGRNADISGTTVSFGVDYRITDTSFPVVIGQDPAINTVYMGDYDMAVGDNSLYYRTWGDNRLPLLTHANQPDVRFSKIPKAMGAGAVITAAGSSVTAESCTPLNNVPDPNETITFNFSLMNAGNASTTNLVATLQATGGVTNPSGPQNYGAMAPGATVARSFTFTVSGACGGTITATLQLQDGVTNLGTVTFTFTLGVLNSTVIQNFDGVVPPALPAGWTTTFSGTGTAVTTSTIFPDTAPNDIFLSEASNVGLSEVTSAPIAITSAGQKLSFRNLFNTEATFDGLVLEISINGGAFADILAAGGTFVSGGYNSTLSTGFQNPLPGRMAWTGLSGGTAAAPAYITTEVNLPAAAIGQNIQLKWRQGSDNSVLPATNPGSRVDTISLTQRVCATSCGPQVSSAVSRKMHGGAGTFDIGLPLTGTAGIECRSGGATDDYQIVVTFATNVSVTGSPQAQVTVGAGQVGSGGVSNGGAVSVSGAVVTIPLTNITNI